MKAKPAAANVPDEQSELGPRLRAIRLRNGVGLRELARRLDLSPSSISQIETGKIRPSVRTLYALAAEFGVTVDELLFDATSSSAVPPPVGVRDGAAEPGLLVQRAVERPAIHSTGRTPTGTPRAGTTSSTASSSLSRSRCG